MRAKGSGLTRFAGEPSPSPATRFLVIRFAAFRICLACFSSGKTAWMVVIEVLDSVSGLIPASVARSCHSRMLDVHVVKLAFCNSLIFPIAMGNGILASWERKRSKACISALVAISSRSSCQLMSVLRCGHLGNSVAGVLFAISSLRSMTRCGSNSFLISSCTKFRDALYSLSRLLRISKIYTEY